MDARIMRSFCGSFTGHGKRRRRSIADKTSQNVHEYTRFKENIEYTVIMPGDGYENSGKTEDQQCKSFLFIALLLGLLLALSTIIVSWIRRRMRSG